MFEQGVWRWYKSVKRRKGDSSSRKEDLLWKVATSDRSNRRSLKWEGLPSFLSLWTVTGQRIWNAPKCTKIFLYGFISDFFNTFDPGNKRLQSTWDRTMYLRIVHMCTWFIGTYCFQKVFNHSKWTLFGFPNDMLVLNSIGIIVFLYLQTKYSEYSTYQSICHLV